MAASLSFSNFSIDDVEPNPAIQDFITILEDRFDRPPSPPSCAGYQSHPQQGGAPRRNLDPQLPEIYVDSCELIGETLRRLGPTARTLKVGDTVQTLMEQHETLQSGDFLRIQRIIKNTQTGSITLRGFVFRRTKFLRPILPLKLNEVYLVVSIDEEDSRPFHIQGIEEIPLVYVVRKRRLVVTDRPFPELSFREYTYFDSTGPDSQRVKEDILNNEVLVCRNIFACIYGKGERRLKRRRPYQGLLRFILAKEADNSGGILTGKRVEHIDLDNDETVILPPTRGPRKERQYTLGDGFQGAGGVSWAGKLAGLKLKWGFDGDEYAVATAAANFRFARVFHCNACDFPPAGFDAHVDILHLSPPCQTFSPVNSRPNARNDELNTDALLAVGSIIRAVKPRIVTLEETFGLLTLEKHQRWFGILLSMISAEGYSVRWGVQNLLEHGIPQPRKRLTLIASAYVFFYVQL